MKMRRKKGKLRRREDGNERRVKGKGSKLRVMMKRASQNLLVTIWRNRRDLGLG
jgi:hypothetical protein